MPTKAEEFSTKAVLSGELDEVPGFGEKGIDNLKRKGIHTTYQIIGKYLALDRDAQALHSFLCSDEIGMNPVPLKTHSTAQRIADRVQTKGFKCEIKLSEHVIKSTVSTFNDAKKTAFMAKKLTGDLSKDFTGIKDVTKFNAAGIRTSDHLFAAFLSIIDDPLPCKNTKQCDEFYKTLTNLGAASGYKSAIIYQLQSKLAVGIDTEGLGIQFCPILPPVAEDAVDEEAYDRGERSPRHGTDEQPRRVADSSRLNGATPRHLDFEDAPATATPQPTPQPSLPPATPKKSEHSALMFALPVAIAVAVSVWMYWPSSSTEIALIQ